ncbi:MAG: hypothetical protein KDC54_22880, partial [Lewinella sp.]|nr:hypothetical protein [Lewinella sp.]
MWRYALILCSLWPFLSWSQGADSLRWGMTSLADRQMTRYEPDTTAIAVVLDEAGAMTIHQ